MIKKRSHLTHSETRKVLLAVSHLQEALGAATAKPLAAPEMMALLYRSAEKAFKTRREHSKETARKEITSQKESYLLPKMVTRKEAVSLRKKEGVCPCKTAKHH